MADHGTTTTTDPEALRRQVADLQQRLAASEGRERIMRQLLDNLPSAIYATGSDGVIALVNAPFASQWGKRTADFEGRALAELFPPEVAAGWQANIDAALRSPGVSTSQETYGEGEQARHYDNLRFPITDESGAVTGLGGVATDVTDLRRSEQERLQLQNEIIEAQQAALRELNTPLIPLAEDVVVMPLIGSIDSARAGQVLETLLEGVSAHRARIAILDITGLPVVDTQVASALLHAAQAVKLLGAEVLLTGIGPEVAQTLVGIGADLSGLKTPGTLHAGIQYALRH